MIKHTKSEKQKSLFWFLFQLTMILFVWQILYLMYFGVDSIVFKAISQRLFFIPRFVWFEIIGYWGLQFFFYTLFSVWVWALTHFIGRRFSLSGYRTRTLGIYFWCLGVLFLFIANNVFYPHSLFGMSLTVFFPYWLSKLTLGLLVVFFLVVSLFAMYEFCRFFYKKLWLWVCLVLLCLAIVFIEIYPSIKASEPVQVGTYKQPNVFIIGLDALRPDRVHFYGYSKNQTPTIDQFLKNSVRFRHAITVMARTSPSWVSILTGQYPKHNGVRFNLVSQQGLKLQNSLGYVFKRQGYETIFSTDGRRYDFIDHNFGFDKVIGADATFTNFVMDLVDDTPMSDLLSNSPIGRYLYPNIYANRDIGFTYHPNAYLSLVEQQMPKYVKKPVFMSIHFTLAHYPYEWATSPRSGSNSVLYDAAVSRADKQLGNFLEYLKQQHLLDNAIVILMSDHGEALKLPGDRMLSQKTYLSGKLSKPNVFKTLNALQHDNTRLDESAGHGTDVLSYSQINTLLAFRRYGGELVKAKTVNQMVALIDIKPTILQMLNLPSPDTDGVSLLPYFRGIKNPYPPRMIFSEIGFTPIALKSSTISIQNAFFQSADLFMVQPKTNRIVMKKSMIKKLLKTKQRAVFYKNWALALYPGKQYKLLPVLINRKTKKWTDDLTTSFAKHSPAKRMLAKLKQFYGREVTEYFP